MGDNTAEPPDLKTVPKKPLETYEWEDLRRQRLAGSYPWTHLYKPPFDNNEWEKKAEKEYEYIKPMEDTKKKEIPRTNNDVEMTYPSGSEDQLLKPPVLDDIPDICENSEEDEDSETNMDEEITASDLQTSIDEKYFNKSSTPASSVEATEPKSLSTLQGRMQHQAERIKEKFKHFREQQAKHNEEDEGGVGHKLKEKFKMKKPHIPDIHLPSAATFRRNISFPNIYFSRSRSSSVRSDKPPTPKRKFDFGTYPRVFRKKKRPIHDDYEPIGLPAKSESVPTTPSQKRKFGQQLFSKFKKDEKENKEKEPKIVQSSPQVSFKPKEVNKENVPVEDDKPTKMIIDNKNFFFISLHEDRTDLPPSPFRHQDTESESNFAPKEEEKIKFPKFGGKQSLWDIALQNKAKLEREKEQSQSSDENVSITITEVVITDTEQSQKSPKLHKQKELTNQTKLINSTALNEDPKSMSSLLQKVSSKLGTQGSKLNEPVSNFKSESTESIPEQRRSPIVETNKTRNQKGGILKKLKQEDSRQLRSLDDLSCESLTTSIDNLKESNRFEEYESALEKSKISSDYYSAVEMGKNNYSSENSLAKLGSLEHLRTNPPARPKRAKSYKSKNKRFGHKENYNTFPLLKPEKPKRKFKRRRKFSTGTNEEINIDDAAISRNLANAKQLSVSFLPLSTNVVDDNTATCYNLRETASMIHINITEPTPVPRKRRKSRMKDSLLQRPISTSMLDANATECQIEYADEISTNTDFTEEFPVRPERKRSQATSFSAADEDLSRHTEAPSSEKDENERSLSFEPEETQDEYHTEPKSAEPIVQRKRTSSSISEKGNTLKNKVRRLSEFFTLPRMQPRENYVRSATLDRRPASPSRPPRRYREHREHVYIDDEFLNDITNFDSALADAGTVEKEFQSSDMLEKMKGRPLPPPPRPPRRKGEEDEFPKVDASGYSECRKKKQDIQQPFNYSRKEMSTERSFRESREASIGTQTNATDDTRIKDSVERSRESAEKRYDYESNVQVVKAQMLQVSELNVGKLNISEVESTKFVTSNIDSVSLHVSEIQGESGNLVINSIELPRVVHSLNENPDTDQSKTIPEDPTAPGINLEGSTKAKYQTPQPGDSNTREISPLQTDQQNTTLTELSYQILQICQSSIGQTIHSMIEQLLPESRDKRNDVQAAIWIITIIVAGCLVLGLGPTEKTIHHHHWDFHFPPPQ